MDALENGLCCVVSCVQTLHWASKSWCLFHRWVHSFFLSPPTDISTLAPSCFSDWTLIPAIKPTTCGTLMYFGLRVMWSKYGYWTPGVLIWLVWVYAEASCLITTTRNPSSSIIIRSAGRSHVAVFNNSEHQCFMHMNIQVLMHCV